MRRNQKGFRRPKKHFMEDGSQMEIYRKIRKPMPPSTKRHDDDDHSRKFDWRREMDQN